MTWPTSDVDTANVDASTDNPAAARTDFLGLIQKFNQLRTHVSVFMQGLLSSADAATARTTLGAFPSASVSSYGQSLIDDADAATARSTLGLVIGSNVPSPGGAGASGTWGINITGSAGYATSAGNGGVTSVNGMTGAVSVTSGVSSLNGQTGAITNTSQDAIGAVEALTSSVINTGWSAGATYAGSSLRRNYTPNASTPFGTTSAGGTACSGTWRCMAGAQAVGGSYSVGLFVRIS